jgi:hypothetical protein
MKAKPWITFLFLNIISIATLAQLPLVYNVENTGAKYKAPTLPALESLPVIDPLTDPFMQSDGRKRSTKFADWQRRRNEIGAEFQHYEIGTKPPRPETITATYATDSINTGTLTVNITVKGHSITLASKVVLPSGPGPFPAVIGMNSLNGSIPADIFTSRNIARISFVHNQVTVYNKPQNTDPFFQLYPDQNIDNTGQYAAWAWGVSRIIDGLELVKASLPIDLKHLAVTGCSYAGKMALISGAFDERIALTMAIESGGGGATAWRVSETLGDVEKLGATSYQWFKNDMIQFAGLNVSRLPHDHHELMAMVAPRALLVTGNTDYFWLANPSNYVAARAAHEVWKTFGIGDRFGFYIDGKHPHCNIPQIERPVVEAFVDKFLLGKNVNTDVTVNPYPDINYQRWFDWWGTKKPVFPDEEKVTNIWLEAECGTIGSNWDVLDDASASGAKYITIKSGLNSTRTAPTDTVTNVVVIPFTIETQGSYNFLAKAIGPTGADDSYWVKIDNEGFVGAAGLIGTEWKWNRLHSAKLTAGQHKLVITYREDGAKLDKILITTSNASSVTSPELASTNCHNQK